MKFLLTLTLCLLWFRLEISYSFITIKYPEPKYHTSTKYNLIGLKNSKGHYRKYCNYYEGYKDARRQITLYVTGKSAHTDSTTTMEIFMNKFIGLENLSYKRYIYKRLKCSPNTLLYTMNSDSLLKYISRYENPRAARCIEPSRSVIKFTMLYPL